MSRQSTFLTRPSLGQRPRKFNVATELSKFVSQQGEPSVATESSRTWSFPCHDIALYVATVGQGITLQRGCASRQCGVVLRHGREGHAHATYQAERARQGWHTMAGRARQRYFVAIKIYLSQQTSYSEKKKKKEKKEKKKKKRKEKKRKKKTPWDWGVTTSYQSICIRLHKT